MSKYVEVLKAGELKEGEMREAEVEGRQILVAKVAGKFYATTRICPHMAGNLAKGKLEGTVVTCPRHGSQFDLKDGHVVRWTDWTGIRAALGRLLKSPSPLKTYPVKVEGEKVLVEV